jgi:hypothetical protein
VDSADYSEGGPATAVYVGHPGDAAVRRDVSTAGPVRLILGACDVPFTDALVSMAGTLHPGELMLDLTVGSDPSAVLRRVQGPARVIQPRFCCPCRTGSAAASADTDQVVCMRANVTGGRTCADHEVADIIEAVESSLYDQPMFIGFFNDSVPASVIIDGIPDNFPLWGVPPEAIAGYLPSSAHRPEDFVNLSLAASPEARTRWTMWCRKIRDAGFSELFHRGSGMALPLQAVLTRLANGIDGRTPPSITAFSNEFSALGLDLRQAVVDFLRACSVSTADGSSPFRTPTGTRGPIRSCRTAATDLGTALGSANYERVQTIVTLLASIGVSIGSSAALTLPTDPNFPALAWHTFRQLEAMLGAATAALTPPAAATSAPSTTAADVPAAAMVPDAGPTADELAGKVAHLQAADAQAELEQARESGVQGSPAGDVAATAGELAATVAQLQASDARAEQVSQESARVAHLKAAAAAHAKVRGPAGSLSAAQYAAATAVELEVKVAQLQAAAARAEQAAPEASSSNDARTLGADVPLAEPVGAPADGRRSRKNNFYPVYFRDRGQIFTTWDGGAREVCNGLDSDFYRGFPLLHQAVEWLQQLHLSRGGGSTYMIESVGFESPSTVTSPAVRPSARQPPNAPQPYRPPSWSCEWCHFSNRDMHARACTQCRGERQPPNAPHPWERRAGFGSGGGGGGVGDAGRSSTSGDGRGGGAGGGVSGGGGGGSNGPGIQSVPPGGPPGLYAAHPQPNPMSAGCESYTVSFADATSAELVDARGVASSFTHSGALRCEYDSSAREFRLFGPRDLVIRVGEHLHECYTEACGRWETWPASSTGHVSDAGTSSSDSSSDDGNPGDRADSSEYPVSCVACRHTLCDLKVCSLVRFKKPLTVPLRHVSSTVVATGRSSGGSGKFGLTEVVCQSCREKVGSIDQQNLVLFKMGRKVVVASASGGNLSVEDIARLERGTPLDPVRSAALAAATAVAAAAARANAIGTLQERAVADGRVEQQPTVWVQDSSDSSWSATVSVRFSGSLQVFTASSQSKTLAHQAACRLALAAFDEFEGAHGRAGSVARAPHPMVNAIGSLKERADRDSRVELLPPVYSQGHDAAWTATVSVRIAGSLQEFTARAQSKPLAHQAACRSALSELDSVFGGSLPLGAATPFDPLPTFHAADLGHESSVRRDQLRDQLRREHQGSGIQGGWGFDAQAALEDQERTRQARLQETREREARVAQDDRERAHRASLQAQVDALELKAQERAALKLRQAADLLRLDRERLDQESLQSAQKRGAELVRAESRVEHLHKLRQLNKEAEAAADAASPGLHLQAVTPSTFGADRRTRAPPPSAAPAAPAPGAAPPTAAAQPIAPAAPIPAPPPPRPPLASPPSLKDMLRSACISFADMAVPTDSMWRSVCEYVVNSAGGDASALKVLLDVPASRRTPPAVSAPARSAPDGYANISDDSDHEHHGQSFYEGSGGSRGRRAPGQPSARARASADRDPERPLLPESLTAEQKKLYNNFEDGIAHGKVIRDEEDAAQALGGKPGCAEAYRKRHAMVITPRVHHYLNFIDPLMYIVAPESSPSSSAATRASQISAGNALRVDGIESVLTPLDHSRLDTALEKNQSADATTSAFGAAREKLWRGDSLRKKAHLQRLAGLKEWDDHGQVVINMLTGAADEVQRRQKDDCRTHDFYWLCLDDMRLYLDALASRVTDEASLFEYRLSAKPFVLFTLGHLHDLYNLFDQNQHGLAFVRASQYCRRCVHGLELPFARTEFQQHSSNARAAAQCQQAVLVANRAAGGPIVQPEKLFFRPDAHLVRNLEALQTLRAQVGEGPKAAMAACVSHAEAFALRMVYRHPSQAERAKRDAKRGSAQGAVDEAALFRKSFVEQLIAAGVPGAEADEIADKKKLDRRAGADESKAACVATCKKFYDSHAASLRD